ncbi:YicC family protein [Enterococcus saccharolyticus]|uniref:YicC family protein n=1 Tax=Candidatus Enterococcus willemsii TaxID=1857215 RepID=A0ABQ6Z0N3_9ENTE|nr:MULTISPECIES: YicC/YloC family endoribonuclease [Enterococcus]KAF1304110.1 YicC family protein [Enterococcus sp. CU12B]MCD5002017.1 YicC family protein [Enterococcus saccharolyticus]
MRSMTGFGKSLQESENYQIEVEMKSVNHRFLDIQLRHPRQLNTYEQVIRQTIKETLQRGRVEVYITLKEKGDSNKQVVMHWDLMSELVTNMQKEARQRFNEDISAASILTRLTDNDAFIDIQEKQTTDTNLESAVIAAVREAAIANNRSREKEGTGIQQVLTENRALLQQKVAELSAFVDVYEADYRERFEKRLVDFLGAEVDQDRLLTELAILIERGDIHEELDRMNIHLTSMAELLAADKPVGRELDFLIQEMNREVNTIGSKSSPIEIKNAVVQMKTTIEKIREQVQNVE